LCGHVTGSSEKGRFPISLVYRTSYLGARATINIHRLNEIIAITHQDLDHLLWIEYSCKTQFTASKDFNPNSIPDLNMPKMEEKASVVLGKDQSS
jgi:hypothetical protein